jgi:hypothetical protein
MFKEYDMSENPFLSYLSNIDWSAAFQWYLNHLDVGYLIQTWEEGRTFSQHDWHTFIVLSLTIFVLLALVHLLIRVHQKSAFGAWIQNRRSQLVERPQKEGQTSLEAKVANSTCLRQAYNLHRFAMYDHALNKYRQAFQSSPYDLNTYLVGIRIISEMEEPNKPFVQFLQAVIANLREKHPAIWNEVAKYGREKAPNLDQWQPAS